jgi:hypothetical protein
MEWCKAFCWNKNRFSHNHNPNIGKTNLSYIQISLDMMLEGNNLEITEKSSTLKIKHIACGAQNLCFVTDKDKLYVSGKFFGVEDKNGFYEVPAPFKRCSILSLICGRKQICLMTEKKKKQSKPVSRPVEPEIIQKEPTPQKDPTPKKSPPKQDIEIKPKFII